MDYLYSLQCLREAAPDFVNAAFVFISENMLTLGPVIAFLIYWCLSKRTGEWMLLTLGVSISLTDFVKIIACIPRPWLFDSRLHLPDAAAGSATGFSFPSGHTTYATSTFGTSAVYASNGPSKNAKAKGLPKPEDGEIAREPMNRDARTLSAIGAVKQRRIWLSVILVVVLIAVAFARNWLGAHTFKDVAVALLLSAAVAVTMYWVMKLLQKRPKADLWVFIIILVLIVGMVLYAELAPAPVVMDGSGNVLDLDHYVLRTDLFGSLGILTAIVVGWFVERRFINFSDATTWRERGIRAIIGMVLFGLAYFALAGLLTSWIPGAHLAKFCKRFVGFIFPALVVPLIIKWLDKRNARTRAAKQEAAEKEVTEA